jgi:hypothetical protein
LCTPSITDPKEKFCCQEWILFWKEFLSKGVNSRKVYLDEVIKPPLHELASGAAPEIAPVVTSPNEVGANDEDHENPK